MEHFDFIPSLKSPQIMVVVASPTGKEEIAAQLRDWDKQAVEDYWFFM